jgi:SAM-dependent methyltransferase
VNAPGTDWSSAAKEIERDAGRIRKNAFLEEIYRDFYARIVAEIPAATFPRTLELGSGGGFLSEIAPHVTTSEPVPLEGVERVVDACNIEASFGEAELDAVCALNVFHHLPNAAGFLRGAQRVLRPGGRIVLVEPWSTPLGQWFHRAIHHEPYVNDPTFWGIVGEGRLAGANTRLPTSVFRDSDERFAREFPALRIVKREPFHKWLYLFSGGLKLNTRIPRFLARRLVELDRRTPGGNDALAIFGLIVVERASKA